MHTDEDSWIDDNGDHHLAAYDRNGLAYYKDGKHSGTKRSAKRANTPAIKPNAPTRGPNAVRKYMLLIAQDLGVEIERQLPDPKRESKRYESFFKADVTHVRSFVEALDKVQRHGSHFPDKTQQAYLDYRNDLDALREAHPGWMRS
jgi:hypothetical protein